MKDQPSTITRLITARAGADRYGCKRGKWYQNVQDGLMTPPIKIGSRFSRWPEHEVDTIVRARVTGADDGEVRRLVLTLLAKRQAQGGRA